MIWVGSFSGRSLQRTCEAETTGKIGSRNVVQCKDLRLSFESLLPQVLFCNVRSFPPLRLDQTKTRVATAAEELDQLCQETLQVGISEVPVEKFEEWKTEVQQVAKEQLSRSARAPSAAVKYFSLVTEVEAARELEAFRLSESFEDSLLCSETVQQVRSLTEVVVGDLRLKEKKLKELERDLFSVEVGSSVSQEAKQKVLEASRMELAEHTILGLRIEIEALLHSLEKYKVRIASEADSAKMRASMRKKEGEVKKHVEAAVSRYNVVIRKGDPHRRREPVSASDLLGGAELPWQFESRPEELLRVGALTQRTVAFKRKVELVEAFNFAQRLQEDLVLVVGEQRSVVAYYSDVITNLDKKIEEHDSEAGVTDEAGLGSQQSRYWVTRDQLRTDRDVRSGVRALLARARAAATDRLREARAAFPHASDGIRTTASDMQQAEEAAAGLRFEKLFAEENRDLEGPDLDRFEELSHRLIALDCTAVVHRTFKLGISVEQLPELSVDMLRTVNYFSELEIGKLLGAIRTR